jgi:holliday junction DNA helicase RuvB
MDANALRPNSFDQFTGQHAIKNLLATSTAAARQRGEALGHVLLLGSAGLGKTSLAGILAREMGGALKVVSAPNLENVIGLLRGLQPRDVVFVDEIHALSRNLEEQFYSALEDFRLDLQFGSRVRSIPLNKFTMIGATTRPAMLSLPLRSRFQFNLRLDYYLPSELSEIIQRSAKILGIAVESSASYTLAASSRGTPRIANSYLRIARDVAQTRGLKTVTVDCARAALAAISVDANGLNAEDRRLLRTLAAANRPVGLDSLAASLDELPESVEASETFLLRSNLVLRTSRGRVLTEAGRNAV